MEKLEETSEGATEEGSFSQDRQTCSRCHVSRIVQDSRNIQPMTPKLNTDILECGYPGGPEVKGIDYVSLLV